MIRGRVSAPLRTRIGGREMEISIKYPEAEEMDLKKLMDMLISTYSGETPAAWGSRYPGGTAYRRIHRQGKPAVPTDPDVGVQRTVQGGGQISKNRCMNSWSSLPDFRPPWKKPGGF